MQPTTHTTAETRQMSGQDSKHTLCFTGRCASMRCSRHAVLAMPAGECYNLLVPKSYVDSSDCAAAQCIHRLQQTALQHQHRPSRAYQAKQASAAHTVICCGSAHESTAMTTPARRKQPTQSQPTSGLTHETCPHKQPATTSAPTDGHTQARRISSYDAQQSSPAADRALEERQHGLDQARNGHHAGHKRVGEELQEELVIQQADAVDDLQQQQQQLQHSQDHQQV
eukprot:GHRQ01030555.1.p1 GENE.GHRQ01030555.1~~GHRQ01030555.1.p1  ORF type:complete len:226 (+),score=39.55 GHRQ01030555.1:364-1041(+)